MNYTDVLATEDSYVCVCNVYGATKDTLILSDMTFEFQHTGPCRARSRKSMSELQNKESIRWLSKRKSIACARKFCAAAKYTFHNFMPTAVCVLHPSSTMCSRRELCFRSNLWLTVIVEACLCMRSLLLLRGNICGD